MNKIDIKIYLVNNYLQKYEPTFHIFASREQEYPKDIFKITISSTKQKLEENLLLEEFLDYDYKYLDMYLEGHLPFNWRRIFQFFRRFILRIQYVKQVDFVLCRIPLKRGYYDTWIFGIKPKI